MKDMQVKERVKSMGEKAKSVKGKVAKVKMIDEFRTFIARGNVLDLAVGVIIGGAFQKIVSSLTDNLISPILGCFSEVDFSGLVLKVGKLELKYGAFLTDIINFIIMAFVVFLIVKLMNRFFEKKEEPAPEVKPEVPADVKLLEEIRDLLKKNNK